MIILKRNSSLNHYVSAFASRVSRSIMLTWMPMMKVQAFSGMFSIFQALHRKYE